MKFSFKCLILITSVWLFIPYVHSVPRVQLDEPEDGATVTTLTPTFFWQTVDGAEHYKLAIYTDVKCTQKLIVTEDPFPTDGEWKLTKKVLVSGKTYYWRVAPYITGSGWGKSSEVREFTVQVKTGKPSKQQSTAVGLTCPECGEPNPPGTKYCVSCGTALSSTAPKPSHAKPEENNEPVTSPVPKEKPVIAVFPFKNYSTQEGDVGGMVANMLITELAQSDIDVVTRDDMEKIMEEHKLSMTGMTKDSSFIQSGKLFGAKYIITGSINEFSVEEDKEYVPTGVGAAVIGSIITMQTGVDLSGYTRNIKDVQIKKLKASVSVQGKLINVETGKIVDTQQAEAESENEGKVEAIQPVNITVESPKFGRTVLGTATKLAVKDLADRLTMSVLGTASGGDNLKRCPACGTRVDATLKFCTNCGTQLK